jgi:hypothetical protein
VPPLTETAVNGAGNVLTTVTDPSAIVASPVFRTDTAYRPVLPATKFCGLWVEVTSSTGAATADCAPDAIAATAANNATATATTVFNERRHGV